MAVRQAQIAQHRHQRWITLLLVGLVLVGGLLYYSHRIDKWLAYDDEGGYLYAAWRISLGELPYRDFLTPQLPAFLYPGALVLKWTGYSVVAARLFSVLYTLAAAWLLFLSVRRVWGDRPALLALVLVIVQRDIFWAGRFFRPEAPMLFWSALGTYLFVRGYPSRQHRLLVLSGLAFGLSAMSKLFGALPLAGIGLFLIVEAVRSRRWREMMAVGLGVGMPFIAVVVAIGGIFSALTPNFLGAVLGHHLQQGRGTPWRQVVLKGLVLYRDYARAQLLYVLAALVGVWVSFRRRERIGALLACNLPTVLSFLAITRGLQERHLTYLAPNLAGLAALAFDWLWNLIAGYSAAWPQRVLASISIGAGLCLALWPHCTHNAWVTGWEEHTTEGWVAYIQAHTDPDEVVMSDYPGLNFFARRRTTPIAAGISRGAALTGQIMGSDLIREIEDYDVQMVLLNVAQGSHQFVNLQDYPAFKQYIQAHFHLSGRREYDYRLLEIYSRDDLWEGEVRSANFGNSARLTGARWLVDEAAPGESLQVALRWQALATMPRDYRGTLRLLDGQGHLWGLGSKLLADVDKDTYWDEEGLEQAVLIPTSRWPVDEATIQVFELPIDLATPPGTYLVRLRVHPKGAWDGLPLIDANGASCGYDLDLGQAHVVRAQNPPDQSLLSMDRRLDLELAPGLSLVGYTLPPSEARPGDKLTLSMFWSASRQPEQAYQLQLDLCGGGQIWGQLVTSPAGSDFPTTRWHSEVLRGQYDLTIDPETPTGEYELWGGLLDEDGLAVGPSHLMGRLKVAGRRRLFQVPEFEHQVNAQLGDVVTLLGYDLSKMTVNPGEDLSPVLYWRADGRMSVAYTVFVHLIDRNQHVWAQQDSQPVRGTCSTTSWLPGEVIVDDYLLRVPDDAPEGTCWIEVGLYDALTGRRLPGVDAQGRALESDRILLGEVVVGRR